VSALFVLLLVGLLIFSASCQFLEFWFQGTDCESNAVVKFSNIIQMNNLFFKKFIFENADSRSR